MKYFSILALVLVLALSISGCGANPTPTATPVDIQSTIAAAAFTVVAQTQAAIPTATPPPPTATATNPPPPTPTFPPLPASQITLTSAPSGNSSSGDPCINQPLPASLQGQPVKMRLNNTTKATLSITIYLNQATDQSQCGYRTYAIDPQQSIVINNLVVGCYTIWAWNSDPKEYFIATNGTTCVDTSDTWVFSISTSSIKTR